MGSGARNPDSGRHRRHDGRRAHRDPHGRVLVRNERIVAVWQGPSPEGVEVGGAERPPRRPWGSPLSGLISLHSHPRENHCTHGRHPPPTRSPRREGGHGSVRESLPVGRRRGPDGATRARRLVSNPADVLAEDLGLGLRGEIVKYAEVASLLGGETAIQGAAPNPGSDGVLIRNVDSDVFDERIAEPRVEPIDSFSGTALTNLARMASGEIDAWLLHLAEECAGRRPTTRRPGLLPRRVHQPEGERPADGHDGDHPRHCARATRLRGDAGGADDPHRRRRGRSRRQARLVSALEHASLRRDGKRVRGARRGSAPARSEPTGRRAVRARSCRN